MGTKQGRAIAVALAVVVVLAAACSSSSGSDASGGSPSPAPPSGPVTIVAHGGTEQIWLLEKPHATYALYDSAGKLVRQNTIDAKGHTSTVASQQADANGALVMRYIAPGSGYVVHRLDGDHATSKPVTVTSETQNPPQSFYAKQKLTTSYGYLTTRDGTKLAINVTLPGPADKGPYPTVIEYSGYDPASPTASTVTISKTIAANQGFATVGVNIRGSGCSGGSFQLWEDAQATDGYDAVEAIAAQPWVLGHKVGMVGISYPATAMLYTAALRPPHLEAIAPMAAYDDGFRALMWPGGIQNKGFARQWVQERYQEAQPANADWTKKQIADGDQTCKDNMRLRGQNLDLAKLIDVMPYYPTERDLGDSFAPRSFIGNIDVPTYLVASWQDEQVGGHAPAMIPQLKTKHAYVTLTNGYHTEGLAEPSVLQRWLEFLQLYVAHQVPDTSKLQPLYTAVDGQITGDPTDAAHIEIPPNRFEPGTTYAQALASYQKTPRVRVLFDEGGSTKVPAGMPTAGFEHGFSTYPVPSTQATTWYLGADGALTSAKPTAATSAATSDRYTSDPSARPEIDLVKGSDSWLRLPRYDWTPAVDGKSLSYLTAPLAKDTVMVGSGSANLWLKSSAADTDLQVTLTEVRPDGKETYVQSGWLRASKRKLDTKESTALEPIITQRQADASPLPKGRFVPVRVEIYPFGHAFRKGSRIRVIISAPGGDKPVWSFITLPGTQQDTIARSASMPSSIVLPVVPGIAVPTGLPACPSLRGQPCRPYVAPR